MLRRDFRVFASFPVEDAVQIALVTDKGQFIPVEVIRIAGRSTQGVIVFETAEDEHVVSVEHITEEAESGNGSANATLHSPILKLCGSDVRSL
jgi:DNA gyrase subunit A